MVVRRKLGPYILIPGATTIKDMGVWRENAHRGKGKGGEKGKGKGKGKGDGKGKGESEGKGGFGKGNKGGKGGGEGFGYQGACWRCWKVGHKAAECNVNWIGEATEEEGGVPAKDEMSANEVVEVETGRPWVVGSVTEVTDPPVPEVGFLRVRRNTRKQLSWCCLSFKKIDAF